MIEQTAKNAAAARSGALKTTTALTPVAKSGEVALSQQDRANPVTP